MIENLRKIILNRIAEVIKRVDYEGVYADGKRPALEELEVLNKLLQNISETDLVNVPDEDIKEGDVYKISDGNSLIAGCIRLPDEDIKEGDVYKISDGNSLIAGCIRLPEVPTPCSKCSNYLESLRTGKMLVCNCTLGLPSITCTYEYKSNIE